LLGLLVFFLWRNAEPVDRIGCTLDNGGKEAALGVGLVLPALRRDGARGVPALQRKGMTWVDTRSRWGAFSAFPSSWTTPGS
jgi:hypothetical protein